MDDNQGTYSCLRLSTRSSVRLSEWVRRNRIPEPVRPSEFHITIAYSHTPISYTPLGQFPPMPVTPIGFELFGEDKTVLVLLVKSALARNRFNYAKIVGAQSDFPAYRPHVTLSRRGTPALLAQLKVPRFGLYVDQETMEPLNPGFGSRPPKIDSGHIQTIIKDYQGLRKD